MQFNILQTKKNHKKVYKARSGCVLNSLAGFVCRKIFPKYFSTHLTYKRKRFTIFDRLKYILCNL